MGCFGHKAALELLLEVGIENIAPAVLDLADQIDCGVRAKGYQVMAERTSETGSGIVSFRHPDIDARQIVADLRQRGSPARPRAGFEPRLTSISARMISSRCCDSYPL